MFNWNYNTINMVDSINLCDDIEEPQEEFVNYQEKAVPSFSQPEVPKFEMPCHVCGKTPATNAHGIYGCDSCSALFTNSITKNTVSICKQERLCNFNKFTNIKCDACMLNLCIYAGMRIPYAEYSSADLMTYPNINVILQKQSFLDYGSRNNNHNRYTTNPTPNFNYKDMKPCVDPSRWDEMQEESYPYSHSYH